MDTNNLIKFEIILRLLAICVAIAIILYLIISYIIKLLAKSRVIESEYIEDISFTNNTNNFETDTRALEWIEQDIIDKMLDSNVSSNLLTSDEDKHNISDLDDSIVINMLQMDDEQVAAMKDKLDQETTSDEIIIEEVEVKTIIEDWNNTTDDITSETADKEIDTTSTISNPSAQIESINKKQSLYQHLLSQIENLKARGILDEFEKKLVQATMEFPEDERMNSMLADFYFDNWDLKKSMSIYKKLYKLNDKDDRSLYHLWLINLELGDVKSAEYLLTKALELKPENPKYLMSMAEVKYNLDDFISSIDAVERAIALRPSKFDYLEILAKLYKESKDESNYHKVLLKMIELDPLNIKVKNELSKIYRS